jgi:hypothetical protein
MVKEEQQRIFARILGIIQKLCASPYHHISVQLLIQYFYKGLLLIDECVLMLLVEELW